MVGGHFLGHFGAPRKTFQPSHASSLWVKAFPTNLSGTEVSVNTFCSLSQLCPIFVDFFLPPVHVINSDNTNTGPCNSSQHSHNSHSRMLKQHQFTVVEIPLPL